MNNTIDHEDDLPQAPPVPPEEATPVGYPILAVANLALAIYFVFISFAPVIWGQFVARFEKRADQFGAFQRLDDPVDRRGDDAKAPESETDKAMAVYDKFRWLHMAIALASVAIAIAFAHSAYMAFFYESISIFPVSGVAGLAAILMATTRALGWGGSLIIFAATVAFAEAIALHVPAVQRHLAGVADEE